MKLPFVPIRLLSVACFVCLFFLLAGCRQARQDATIPAPPATSPVTPAPAVASPTATAALSLPATITPVPTATLPPTPEATLAPGQVVLLAAADFGDDRNPLTGELVEDPAALLRRPIAVKLSNAPPQFVRPQSGLNDATVVFEHVTEGSITRLTAVFHGKQPADVGPIRSARLIDLEIPAMYDAALVYSGSSAGVGQRLNQSDFTARILRSGAGYYRTGANKPFEHTLYGKLDLFWQQLAEIGQNRPPNITSHMAFSSEPPPGGTPATALTIDYRWEVVRWQYDEETARYRRWAGGEPQRDGNTGDQVQAANVVVVFANHVEDRNICEEIRDGRCLHLSVEIQVWGSGPAVVFRDRQRYDVTWRRVNRSDMLTFYDQDGAPFPLQIGNTWFQMVPFGREDSLVVIP